ncbi:MAG: DUF2270 domain-containing protein [Pseudomonadota bacterium]
MANLSSSQPAPIGPDDSTDLVHPAKDASGRPTPLPEARDTKLKPQFSGAEIGALAHLYRGEVYRSTIWRTRLDATTNWSVVSLGIALSLSYSSPTSSPLPLLLVGVLIMVFLFLEARRYRYFNVWRARARWMERHFYAPMLKRENYEDAGDWQQELADDYQHPEYHISFWRAFGRRLRRNYQWIFLVQGLSYIGKIVIHPTPVTDMANFFERMVIGPAPGWAVLAFFASFHIVIATFTLVVYYQDRARLKGKPQSV